MVQYSETVNNLYILFYWMHEWLVPTNWYRYGSYHVKSTGVSHLTTSDYINIFYVHDEA